MKISNWPISATQSDIGLTNDLLLCCGGFPQKSIVNDNKGVKKSPDEKVCQVTRFSEGKFKSEGTVRNNIVVELDGVDSKSDIYSISMLSKPLLIS